MGSVFGRIAPTLTARVSLGLDLAALAFLLPATTLLSGRGFAPFPGAMPGLLSASLLAWVVAAIALRHYDPGEERSLLDDLAMVTVLVTSVTTVLVAVTLLAPGRAVLPRVDVFFTVALQAFLILRVLCFRMFSHQHAVDEVLVIGTGALGRMTAQDLSRPRSRQRVIGFVSLPGDKTPSNLSAPILGSSDQLAKFLAEYPVTEIYIAGNPARDCEAMQAATRVCETFGVDFALPVHSFRLGRARPLDAKIASDGYLHYINIDPKPAQMALKRLLDIVASGVALWLLLPLFMVVAALIRLTSAGPVFFRQIRVGLNGRHFRMLKFRSMIQDAEALKAKLMKQNEQSGPVFKMKSDPRVTRVGRWLRKYSIDELPQLINVLRGDMSLVGPRPPVPNEVKQYMPWQRRRLSVRPGITCIWQVSGRNNISFEEWMYMDMQYIDNWSLGEDLNLLVKTVPAVLSGHGAS